MPDSLGQSQNDQNLQRRNDDHRWCGRSSESQRARHKSKLRLANPNISSYDKEKLEERLAKLVGGVAIINVGAATETETEREKSAR